MWVFFLTRNVNTQRTRHSWTVITSVYTLVITSSNTVTAARTSGMKIPQTPDYRLPLQPTCLPSWNGLVSFLNIHEAGIHSDRPLWLPWGRVLLNTYLIHPGLKIQSTSQHTDIPPRPPNQDYHLRGWNHTPCYVTTRKLPHTPKPQVPLHSQALFLLHPSPNWSNHFDFHIPRPILISGNLAL